MSGNLSLMLARTTGSGLISVTVNSVPGANSITVPSGAGFFTAEGIGNGGSGFGNTTVGNRAGGGGAPYVRSNVNIATTPGDTIYYYVGSLAGFDSWVNTLNVAPTSSATGCLAKGGTNAASATAGVGNPAGCVGTVNAGGNGAVGTSARGGGSGGATTAGSSFTAGTDTTGLSPGSLLGGGTGGASNAGGTQPGGAGGSHTSTGTNPSGGTGRIRIAFYGPAPPAPSTRLTTSFTGGGDRTDFGGEVGWQFQVNASRSISWMGARVTTANTGLHTVNLYDGASLVLLATASVDMTGKNAGSSAWTSITPITLVPGVTYVLVKPVTVASQAFIGQGPMTAQSVAQSVMAAYRGASEPFATTVADAQFGGIDLGW
jgi:hypothetical protein